MLEDGMSGTDEIAVLAPIYESGFVIQALGAEHSYKFYVHQCLDTVCPVGIYADSLHQALSIVKHSIPRREELDGQ